MLNEIRELEKALGISPHGARLYFAALQHGGGTLTELARWAALSRTVTSKPIVELIESGLFSKRTVGKRVYYQPLNPQQLVSLIDKKKQRVIDLSHLLLQQISALEQDLQVRWFSGIAGIQTVLREFFSKSKGKSFRHFENAETYNYVGKAFADELIKIRVERGIPTWVVVIADSDMDAWYKAHIGHNKEELRETIVLSSNEYPFKANIGASEDEVAIFEYAENPFALLVENRTFAQSIRSIHKIVWDRYRGPGTAY